MVTRVSAETERKLDARFSTLSPGKRPNRVRREKVMVHSGSLTRPETGSLHPVAIRAAVEATKLLKPLVQKVTKVTRRACRP
jgi:hypothetical protein